MKKNSPLCYNEKDLPVKLKNTKAIKEYIAEQLKKDQESDQLSFFDPRNPFMGSE